ncbi:MAG TPA: hypothetical protein DCY79_15515 [Planctomycetaceae bacterium]|nr:hypothetical protein [Planctomycetaceae bacterium]
MEIRKLTRAAKCLRYGGGWLAVVLGVCVAARAQSTDGPLPEVPAGFRVQVYAAEPLVRNPCAMAFDHRGRLFVSQGPQYRKPTPETPGDRITLLIDSDGDGRADKSQLFADGFNHIQGLAWRGDQLWVANAPELTMVQDTDGDDQADQYTVIYGGLGNLEHALHGLNFAPDGRLYMTKGNSKGYVDAASPERRVAPRAFADLWGVKLPPGAAPLPTPKTYTRQEYLRGYHHPSDDWGTEGGILRCEADGSQLEIVSRGMRNMWDAAYDQSFNWIGTDQDQDGGDRILNPFMGAHFGWGHAWSPDWIGDGHLPTVPISGPVFHGSGTGVASCASGAFPEKYRGTFFCADWLNRKIFVFRPQWKGSLLRNMTTPEVFAAAPTGRSLGSSTGMVFDPVDIEFGPNGALWVLSWGHSYGATIENGQQVDAGRVYRIQFENRQPQPDRKRNKPYREWTTTELIHDLRHDRLPAQRIGVQDELLRRGAATKPELLAAFEDRQDIPGARTWIIWTLAQMAADDVSINQWLASVSAGQEPLADRIQAIRCLGDRKAVWPTLGARLKDAEPRIRFATLQALREAYKQATDIPPELINALWSQAAVEQDRGAFFVTWHALLDLLDTDAMKSMLQDDRAGVRRAALLALLEDNALSGDDVVDLRLDPDAKVAEIAASFLDKVGTSTAPVLEIRQEQVPGNQDVLVRLVAADLAGVHVRYTQDGTEPTDTTGIRYKQPFTVSKNTQIAAALFRARERFGPVIREITGQAGPSSRLPELDLTVRLDQVETMAQGRYVPQVLETDALAYGDRSYRWRRIPQSLVGHTVMRTLNADEHVGSHGDRFLSFVVDEPVTVYVGHDERIVDKPAWLRAFKRTDLKMATRDATYRLFARSWDPGKVELGGNTVRGQTQSCSQYVVVVSPAPLVTRETATTWEQVQSQLESADARRGGRLFFTAASCGKCHKIGPFGQALAPNLSNLGTRANAKAIAESILNPSAVITEGYHTLAVQTVEGQSYSGFVRRESGLNLELVQVDGKVISIPQKQIEVRRRQQKSVMPSGYAQQLTAQQVADVIAFIQATKQQPGETTKPMDDARALDGKAGRSGKGFSFERQRGALNISLHGQPIVSYVFQHNEVKRPFFAHVKTTRGVQVTRNFPPIKGQDPHDHGTMHPGIWLAFAGVSGVNFWHNKDGRVVHDGFAQEPSGTEILRFTTRERYENAQGEIVFRTLTKHELRPDPSGWLLTVDTEFLTTRPLEFIVREEMGLGVRVATPMTVKSKNGEILSGRGGRDEKGTWGKVDRWWDYFATLAGRRIGLLVMSDEGNPDVWSHSRDYGLLVANPFPVDVAANRDLKTVVDKNRPLRLRFGILIHDTPENVRIDQKHIYAKFKERP